MVDCSFRDHLITACSEFSRSFTRIAARGIFFDAVRPYWPRFEQTDTGASRLSW